LKIHNNHENLDCHELINDRARSHALDLEAITKKSFPSCKERMKKLIHRSNNFSQAMQSELLNLEKREMEK